MSKRVFPGPIRPDEVAIKKRVAIPDEVFTVFNEFIAKNFRGGEARVMQDKVVTEVTKRMKVSRQTIFDNGWMEVEEAYRYVGWSVVYDKPGFGESYPAAFTFRPQSRR